jgi:hypothetical protein
MHTSGTSVYVRYVVCVYNIMQHTKVLVTHIYMTANACCSSISNLLLHMNSILTCAYYCTLSAQCALHVHTPSHSTTHAHLQAIMSKLPTSLYYTMCICMLDYMSYDNRQHARTQMAVMSAYVQTVTVVTV